VHIVIDTQSDPERWRAVFRHMLRRGILRLRLVGGVLMLLGLVVVAIDVGTPADFWPLGALLIGLGLGYALVLPGKALRASLRRLPPALQQPQRIELTDRSVQMISPLVSIEYAWAAFVRIEEIPGVLLLMVARNQVLPVPIGGLAPHELAQLREFVANREFVRQ
jgi:hypothetical protein